jgi:hypothetical protein
LGAVQQGLVPDCMPLAGKCGRLRVAVPPIARRCLTVRDESAARWPSVCAAMGTCPPSPDSCTYVGS